MIKINMVAQNTNSTVVSEFKESDRRATAYQSEADLEREFINQLVSQGYERLNITRNEDLVQNLRNQLSKLNNYEFTDNEWRSFFDNVIANPNDDIVEKTFSIQEDHVKILKRENGEEKNIYLLDKDNIHNNTMQVINQYEVDTGVRANRYDVTVLVNGLPLIHIELKKRGVDIKEAFNQINRYQR